MNPDKKQTAASFLAVIIFLLNSACAFGFQFEEYEWGQSKDKLEKVINARETKDIKTSRHTIVYTDKILSSECRVTLIFTGITHRLCSVMVVWDTTQIGDDLREILTEKYGKPVQPNLYKRVYDWNGKTPYEKISLNYDVAETSVIYYGGEYYEMLLEEQMKNRGQEDDRF